MEYKFSNLSISREYNFKGNIPGNTISVVVKYGSRLFNTITNSQVQFLTLRLDFYF